jgi:anti-anti-sigma factor
MPADFGLSVVGSDGRWLVRPHGDLDIATVAEFRAALGELHGSILIDCSELRFISATGLDTLVEVSNRNGTLRLTNVGPMLRSMLDATGLTPLLVPDER